MFAETECVSEKLIVSDTQDVTVLPLPSITKTGAIPEEIRMGETAEVYVVHSLGTIVWMDSSDVANHTADTTVTRAAEGRDRPEWMFVAMLTDSNGCVTYDTVSIRVRTTLMLDSVLADRIITSDIPDEPNDTVPTVVFRGDTAYVKACSSDYITLTLFCTGDDRPFTYQWHGLEPVEGDEEEGRFTFLIDRHITDWYCVITDTSNNSVTAHVVLDHSPVVELILTAGPKMDLGKYYQSQRVEISVAQAYYNAYRFYKYENGRFAGCDTISIPHYKTSFNYNDDHRNENIIFASVTDTNSCRITGKLEIGVLPMPNTMILNDPSRPDDNRIFPNFRITVYNSWGIKIKDRNDGYGWDGTDRTGQQVGSGTYFYYVEIKIGDGTIETINGAVTVFKKK
jgi:hypothetical protein